METQNEDTENIIILLRLLESTRQCNFFLRKYAYCRKVFKKYIFIYKLFEQNEVLIHYVKGQTYSNLYVSLFDVLFFHLIAFHRGFMLSTEENQPLETREHCCHSE
jgi:hypothetical protein